MAYAFIVSEEVRHMTSLVVAEIFIVIFCTPPLIGAIGLLGTYTATLIIRPNSLGPIDWYTAAWLQGVAASLLALLASPLVAQLLAAVGKLDEVSWSMHVDVPMVLPHLSNASDCWSGGDKGNGNGGGAGEGGLLYPLHLSCLASHLSLPVIQLPLDVQVQYSWWLLGASIFAATTAVFALHLLVSVVLLGCCGATPAMWRYTKIEDDDKVMAELRDFVGAAAATQRTRYQFGMALRDAWLVSNPTLDGAFNETLALFRERGKPSSVNRLFHGTRRDSARAILNDGFRLPPHAGMYGRGIYFADCPLKSLQYAGWGIGWRYMLICDVELGRTLVQTSGARPEIDPQGGTPIAQQGWIPSLLSQPSFDSVSAPATMAGKHDRPQK